MEHPFEPHDQDRVTVEVVHPQGVKEDGKEYKKGMWVTLSRGHAMAQNRPGGQVYRVIKTVRYHNDPNPSDSYEQPIAPQPLDVSGDGINAGE